MPIKRVITSKNISKSKQLKVISPDEYPQFNYSTIGNVKITYAKCFYRHLDDSPVYHQRILDRHESDRQFYIARMIS